ncbi:TRAP transporter small permease subunit [Hoeflea sp.]|uniref:TRAP transporter small permease n=1 Tax=Hoeflea sp. TaxID=1940281 RepID=UPI0025BF1A83|nr:TRAP transporter small permease subunit [Hoeflea sp.]MBU4528589.1 TRAP transporter small permease subunit [Alphaproteobacteria bacterium]MBU4545606.1 TRAP transporter small permease subunit [Alphaproteobacteria bacterium]MBU4552216.1 TRAP transporter small permease subunit [Alphaproteobacteria bacterium]
MTAILTVLRPLALFNTFLLRIGRNAAWMAMGLMVVIIMLQVIFRYVFNNALAWPDEAARFLMLWMTGLIAPSAYRWGGFVAIDMLKDLLPLRLGSLLGLLLLLVSLVVLVYGFQLGLNHVKSGWLFNSSSLKIPLDFLGLGLVRVKLAWMYMSLPVGLLLMSLVNVELCLKAVAHLIDPDADLPEDHDRILLAVE